VTAQERARAAVLISSRGNNYDYVEILMRNRLARLMLLIAANAIVVMVAYGQGVIVPGPCERCPMPPRPVHFATRLADQIDQNRY